MPSACGVTWNGTSSGTLDRSAIPDDDFESHFMNAAETKSDSSFPVVDGDGNLRAGNVNAAWDLRNQGDGVSEECLRKLDGAFDDQVLPDSAYENTVKIAETGAEGNFGINLEFNTLPTEALSEGFNRHGVRENDNGSLDVRFKAMRPGVRQGVKITKSFLDNIARNTERRIPLQLDHSKSQRANVGFIKPDNIKFSGEFLQVQARIPNTGSDVRDDIIADFKHEPPQIQDISVGFNPQTLELNQPDKRGEEPEFVDAQIQEFSLTPFPAGYENGGLTPAFSEAIENIAADDEEEPNSEETESQLLARPHIIVRDT